MKNMVKWTGLAAMLGGVIVFSGCQSSKVMDNRQYVPAASGDDVPAAAQPAAAPSEVKDLPVEPAPAAPAAAPGQQRAPRFDEVEYEPVKPAHKPAAKGGTYVVKKGDTISKIAYAHGVRTSDVMAANNLDEKKARRLYVGTKLVIPEGGKVGLCGGVPKAAPKSGKSGKGSAKAAAPASSEASGDVYVVKKGDTIPKIARKLHVKPSELMAANNLDEAATRRLQVGQKLAIPGKGAAPAASDPAPAAQPAPETTAAPAEAPAAQPAPAAEAAPAEAAATADKVDDSAIPTSTIDTIKADITLRDYLKEKNISLDEFRKLNANAFSGFAKKGGDVLDDVIPAGMQVFVPAPAKTTAP